MGLQGEQFVLFLLFLIRGAVHSQRLTIIIKCSVANVVVTVRSSAPHRGCWGALLESQEVTAGGTSGRAATQSAGQ